MFVRDEVREAGEVREGGDPVPVPVPHAPVGRAEFARLLSGLESFVLALRPEEHLAGDARSLVADLARAEKLCANARILMSRRVTQMVADLSGKTSPAALLAEDSGESVGRTRRDLETGRLVESQPVVEEALRRGEISSTQAAMIATAAELDPGAAEELVRAAGEVSLPELRDQCRQVAAAKTAEEDAIERDARIRARRHLRMGVTEEGSVWIKGELPAVEGAAVKNALQARRGEIFKQARTKDRAEWESYDAYLADALVSICQQASETSSSEGATPRCPRAEIVLHVSAEALRRGELSEGEFCVIDGVGPVPLATVEYLFGSAFVSIMVNKGKDVVSITRLGRIYPVHLDAALRARDPVCAVPGCGVRFRLERDHIVPVGKNGPTELENLVRLCHRHHYLKTHGYYAISRGEDGRWYWDSLRKDQELVAPGDECDVALPGEPVAGLARPELRPNRVMMEMIDAQFREERAGPNGPDEPAGPAEPAEPDGPAEPGGPAEAEPPPPEPPVTEAVPVQQTFACRRRVLTMRLPERVRQRIA